MVVPDVALQAEEEVGGRSCVGAIRGGWKLTERLVDDADAGAVGERCDSVDGWMEFDEGASTFL